MSAGTVQAFAMIPQQAIMDISLSHAELRMLAIVAARRNSRHGWTDASHACLAADHGLAPKSDGRVRQLLMPLIEKGYIERHAGSGRTNSRYRVIYDRPKPSAEEMRLIDEANAEDGSDQTDFNPPDFSDPVFPNGGRALKNDPVEGSENNPRTIFLEPEERTREERSLRSLTPHTRKTPVKIEETDPDFQAFWRPYPRHEAMADALKAFNQVATKATIPDILRGLEAQISAGVFERIMSDARQRGYHPSKFIKLPATWLRGKHWRDEISTCQRTPFRNGAAELLAREWMEPTIEGSATPLGMIEGPAHG